MFATKNLVKKLKNNHETLQKTLDKKGITDFDMDKISKSKTTFEFDNEFTLKVLANDMTHEEYYKCLSCIDVLESINNPMFFIHSKNDPICR
jgi:predicted alpha/beta-fold hydrolase